MVIIITGHIERHCKVFKRGSSQQKQNCTLYHSKRDCRRSRDHDQSQNQMEIESQDRADNFGVRKELIVWQIQIL